MFPKALAGTQVAIVTPFRNDGDIDWQALRRLLDLHIECGTNGVVVGGSTGESVSLTDAELRELVSCVHEHAGSRLNLIVGCGTSCTATTVARAREFSRLPGVSGLLVVTPAYNRPPQEGLFRHFQAVAEASAVPIIMYNVMSRTAVDLLPETVARLAQVPGIAGIKEAMPSIPRVRELVAACPPDFMVLSGDDATARESILNGARGVVSVTANVVPALVSRMIRAALDGDEALAAELDARLAELDRAMFLESNPIPAKWAMERMGLIGGTLRLPLVDLSARHHVAVEKALCQAGVTLAAAA